MPNFESGVSAAIVVDGRDESRLNNKANIQDGREMLDTTTFGAVQSAKIMDYGLYSGMCDFNGFSQLDNATLKEQMATTLGKNRDIHRVLVGPHGLQVGLEALFFEALQASFSTDLGLAGVPSAAMQFAFSKYVVRDGVCLHTLTGADSVGGNEVVALSFSATPIQQFLAVAPQSAPAQKFSFRLSDYGSDAALIAALKTAIQNMAVFAGRTVTITGALTGTTTKTGVLRIEFDGAVNVDSLVATQGALHELDFSGATGIKTVYGTVAIDPANSTAASVQTDVQAKGGQFAGCIVSKIGAGGNAIYLFAFPVGATPANLTQPNATINEVQTVTTGAGFMGGAIPLVGSSATVNITPGDSLALIGNTVSSAFGAANGSIVAGGTTTLAVNGGTYPNTIRVKNAAAGVGGDYGWDGTTLNAGKPVYVKGGTRFVWNNGTNWFQSAAVGTTSSTFSSNLEGSYGLGITVGVPSLILSNADTNSGTYTWDGATVSGGLPVYFNGTKPIDYDGGADYWFVRSAVGDEVQFATPNTNNGVPRGVWTGIPGGCVVTVASTNVGSPGVLAVTLTVQAGSTLAGQNLAQLTTNKVGVTTGTPTQGGVGPDPQTSVLNTPGGAATSSSANVLQNGGMSTDPVYNVVTQSGADDWVDGGAATAVGFVFRSHALVLALGASVQVILEHTDGAGAPNVANASTLATHNHTVVGAQGTNDEAATVKRWTRTRYVLTGASALFTAAVARE